jgi:hypothetical protein
MGFTDAARVIGRAAARLDAVDIVILRLRQFEVVKMKPLVRPPAQRIDVGGGLLVNFLSIKFCSPLLASSRLQVTSIHLYGSLFIASSGDAVL